MHPATRRLVVFLSSVRRGLEQERDNLPALIQAIGHECKRLEDYTAQPVPSRQACLRGVDQADVYLLLGGRYGEPVFDSGLSPTEEEFTRARQRGTPHAGVPQAGHRGGAAPAGVHRPGPGVHRASRPR